MNGAKPRAYDSNCIDFGSPIVQQSCRVRKKEKWLDIRVSKIFSISFKKTYLESETTPDGN